MNTTLMNTINLNDDQLDHHHHHHSHQQQQRNYRKNRYKLHDDVDDIDDVHNQNNHKFDEHNEDHNDDDQSSVTIHLEPMSYTDFNANTNANDDDDDHHHHYSSLTALEIATERKRLERNQLLLKCSLTLGITFELMFWFHYANTTQTLLERLMLLSSNGNGIVDDDEVDAIFAEAKRILFTCVAVTICILILLNISLLYDILTNRLRKQRQKFRPDYVVLGTLSLLLTLVKLRYQHYLWPQLIILLLIGSAVLFYIRTLNRIEVLSEIMSIRDDHRNGGDHGDERGAKFQQQQQQPNESNNFTSSTSIVKQQKDLIDSSMFEVNTNDDTEAVDGDKSKNFANKNNKRLSVSKTKKKTKKNFKNFFDNINEEDEEEEEENEVVNSDNGNDDNYGDEVKLFDLS